MKIDRFNVVELKDGNRATIVDVKEKNEYFAELVNAYGISLGTKVIKNSDINQVVFSKNK